MFTSSHWGIHTEGQQDPWKCGALFCRHLGCEEPLYSRVKLVCMLGLNVEVACFGLHVLFGLLMSFCTCWCVAPVIM